MTVSTQAGGHQDAATLPRAERAIGFFVAGIRVATLAQMLPSVVSALDVTEHRALTVFTWVLASTMALATATLCVVRRKPPGPAWATLDTLVAVALILIGLITVPVELRTGSWVGFQSAYSLSVAASLVGVRDVRLWGTLLGLLVVARTIYVLPIINTPADVPTVVGELFTMLGLAPLAWAGVGAVLQIAQDADESRAYAARLAREDEERKARSAIHNGTALMKILVEQGELGAIDSRTPSQVWVQAATELNRMRAYLAGGPGQSGQSGQEPHDLAELVENIATEFTDLPLDVVPDLARGTTLGSEATDVATALRSILINVRQHASASRVVLHAEELEDAPGWAVTVHDDGVGFDPDHTTFGVGIRTLTLDQLSPHGIETTIDSVPGIGTTVTLTRGGAG
jgi:signal transduction histidine kinase